MSQLQVLENGMSALKLAVIDQIAQIVFKSEEGEIVLSFKDEIIYNARLFIVPVTLDGDNDGREVVVMHREPCFVEYVDLTEMNIEFLFELLRKMTNMSNL